LGKWLIGIGIALVILGILVTSGALTWFGRLPGDIRIEGESYRFYLPMTSMLIVSVAISLIVQIVRRFL
jgi:hypothetical protein